MEERKSISITSLITIPALITLGITILRLVGELEHWPKPWFSAAGGGGGAIVGISWLPIVFVPTLHHPQQLLVSNLSESGHRPMLSSGIPFRAPKSSTKCSECGAAPPLTNGVWLQNWKGRASQAAEKPVWPVIPRSPPFLLADDEESRTALKILRARFLAPLGMTAWRSFSAACSAPPLEFGLLGSLFRFV